METHEVTIEYDGDEWTIEVPEDEYILDAAEDEGIDLPYSCREGNCTSCAGLVDRGEVNRGGVALSIEEEMEGYVLLCSSYATSDCRILAGVQDEVFDSAFDDFDDVF